MDRRPLMTVVAGASLAVAAFAAVAVTAPDGSGERSVPGVIARFDVRRAGTGQGGVTDREVGALGAREPAAPSTSIVLPPLPSNTGPDATFDAPFVVPGETSEPGVDPGVSNAGALAAVAVVDDLGMITIDLPTAWGALDTAPVGANPALAASPDWDRWADWEAPGVVAVAYPTIVDPVSVLAADELSEFCRAGPISRFTERDYRGVQQIFTDCGGDFRVVNYVWIVSPADRAHSLYVNVQLTGGADRGVLELIRSSFAAVAGATLPAGADPAPTVSS